MAAKGVKEKSSFADNAEFEEDLDVEEIFADLSSTSDN